MKKSILLSVMMLTVVAFTFTSCNKYDEGSNFSILSAKSRLVNTWKVDKITYTNGSSSTSTTSDEVLTINKDGSGNASGTTFGIPYSIDGKWAFNSDKTTVTLTPDNSAYSTETYTIIKLKKDELSLQQIDGNTTTRTDFVTK